MWHSYKLINESMESMGCGLVWYVGFTSGETAFAGVWYIIEARVSPFVLQGSLHLEGNFWEKSKRKILSKPGQVTNKDKKRLFQTFVLFSSNIVARDLSKQVDIQYLGQL